MQPTCCIAELNLVDTFLKWVAFWAKLGLCWGSFLEWLVNLSAIPLPREESEPRSGLHTQWPACLDRDPISRKVLAQTLALWHSDCGCSEWCGFGLLLLMSVALANGSIFHYYYVIWNLTKRQKPPISNIPNTEKKLIFPIDSITFHKEWMYIYRDFWYKGERTQNGMGDRPSFSGFLSSSVESMVGRLEKSNPTHLQNRHLGVL